MNRWLLLAGSMSAAASLLHLGVIAGGPAWYRFFGAGEGMARMAERGDPTAALITVGIAGVLAVWAAYAFSGAGLIPRLPLLRTGLIVISTIYLLRGLVLIPAIALNPQASGIPGLDAASRKPSRALIAAISLVLSALSACSQCAIST